MEHDHRHHAFGGSNLLLAFFLNAVFAVVEFIGGYLTNSVAVTSDALHDLGDSIALLFAYFAEKLGDKSADRQFTYGYRRFSVLSALINGVILFSGSLFIMYEAIARLQNPEPVKAEGMFLLALLGIAVNGFAAFRLSKGSGMNQRMVMYHLLEDLMGWGGVLLVSVVLFFRPWHFLDSILSLLIALIILRGVYKNLLKVGAIFLQKFPDDLEMDKIVREITAINGVKDVHAVRGWALDESRYSLSFHVAVPAGTVIEEIDAVKKQIKSVLGKENVRFSSIEFEAESPNNGQANGCC